MKVCMGGTFDVLHAGHEALLRAAFALAAPVFIGLTTDRMAREGRPGVNRFPVRKQRLEAWLRRNRFARYTIGPLDDPYGPSVSGDYTAIVVSEARHSVAEAINAERAKAGRPPLEIRTVPMVLAQDGLPIASRRIRTREIDRRGRIVGPVRVHVGTQNVVKVDAVRRVFGTAFPDVRVRKVRVAAKVPEQPFGPEAVDGAIERARAAIGDAHFGVGVEAGLVWNEPIHEYLDVQYCAVLDRGGRLTVGHGPGFAYPPTVLQRVHAGRTVGEAMVELTGIRSIGSKQGAVGYLSGRRMDRTKLTETAVLMAMIPRFRADLYLPL